MKKAMSGEDKEAIRASLQQALTPEDLKEADGVWAGLPKNDKDAVSGKDLRPFLQKKAQEAGTDENDLLHIAGRIVYVFNRTGNDVSVSKDELLSVLGELKLYAAKKELAYFRE